MRLHDFGKIAIPDAILNKPGPLDQNEFDTMKNHCLAGSRVLRAIQLENHLGDDPVLTMASEIALSHHERWDGRGYPQGLAGADIPMAARVAILIDIYDSLLSPRIYKQAFSHAKALEIMQDMAPQTFDPDLYDIFTAISHRLHANRHKFASMMYNFT